MTAIEKIESLIPHLPEGDRFLAFDFLKERDFESLQSLVNSAIYKIRKSQLSENQKEKYDGIDIIMLGNLKTEIDLYTLPLKEVENNFIDDDEYIEETLL